MGINMGVVIDSERSGWFKFLVAELTDVVSSMLAPKGGGVQFSMVPFLYGKLDTEVSFDGKLSIPLVSVEKPVFVLRTKEQLSLVSITEIMPEHEKRIYIPAGLILGIIPIAAGSDVVTLLVNAGSSVYKPTSATSTHHH